MKVYRLDNVKVTYVKASSSLGYCIGITNRSALSDGVKLREDNSDAIENPHEPIGFVTACSPHCNRKFLIATVRNHAKRPIISICSE